MTTQKETFRDILKREAQFFAELRQKDEPARIAFQNIHENIYTEA